MPMKWRIYNSDGNESAACHFAEDAAAFVSILGDFATVRYRGDIVWTEGKEDFSAAESYDAAGEIMNDRVTARKL